MTWRGNAAFKRDLGAFVKRGEDNAEQLVRKVALTLLAAIVKRSPVDTGRFRGNWAVQATPAPRQTDAEDKGGGATINAGLAELARFKVGDQIYILNHLPYAIELERGSSQQAPAGMVRITVTEFEQYVRNAAAGLKK